MKDKRWLMALVLVLVLGGVAVFAQSNGSLFRGSLTTSRVPKGDVLEVVKSSSSTKEELIPVGTNNAVLASFDLKAGNEDIEIQKLDITILEGASDQMFNEIDSEEETLRGTIQFKIDGQTVYSTAASPYNSRIYLKNSVKLVPLSTYYGLRAGKTAKLTVEGNIKNAQAYIVRFDEVAFQLASTNTFKTLEINLWGNPVIVIGSGEIVKGMFSLIRPTEDSVYVYDITPFKEFDPIRIDANADGTLKSSSLTNIDEKAVYYVCNISNFPNTSSFQLKLQSDCSGSVVDIKPDQIDVSGPGKIIVGD